LILYIIREKYYLFIESIASSLSYYWHPNITLLIHTKLFSPVLYGFCFERMVTMFLATPRFSLMYCIISYQVAFLCCILCNQVYHKTTSKQLRLPCGCFYGGPSARYQIRAISVSNTTEGDGKLVTQNFSVCSHLRESCAALYHTALNHLQKITTFSMQNK